METLSDERLKSQIVNADSSLAHIRRLKDDLHDWSPTTDIERQIAVDISRKLRIAEDRLERRRRALDRM